MKYIAKRYMIITGLLLLLAGLAACGSSEKPAAAPAEKAVAPVEEAAAPAEAEISGEELVARMEAAIKAVNKAHFTIQFQMSTTGGGVRGNIEIWNERPNNFRAEITSETEELASVIFGSNDAKSWVYSPDQETIYVGSEYSGAPNLHDQPEIAKVLNTVQQIRWHGLENTEATYLASEAVNGHNTHKVEVTYKESDDPNIDLSGVMTTFWIDQETFLPQKIEVNFSYGLFTGMGMVILKGNIVQDEAINEKSFAVPELPGSFVLVDLNLGTEEFIADFLDESLASPPDLDQEPGEMTTEQQ